tara:strand:+ start:1481 stop:3553 length:2073 start_codon:yes stop_codon:yes gene_type:complete
MSIVYKKFKPQDYAIVPFNAHKQYNFVSSSASSNSINHYHTKWTSESIDLYTKGNIKYNQIDHLFYRNFKKINSFSSGDKYLGQDNINYLKHKRVLYKEANILSIPAGLYGYEIRPTSLYISSSTHRFKDDGFGNLISSSTNLNEYETDIRSNVLNIGPVNGFKRYDLNVYDGYSINGRDQYFYLNGVKKINPISSYSTPEGDEYDDSYLFNLINYKNVNFSEQTLFNGNFPVIDFASASNSSLEIGHKGDFNFNPGDDFTISFWTNVRKPTVGQLIINVNNITASAAGNENLTLISSDGTTKTYRCTAGTNGSDLGSGITSIQWKIAQATADKDDVKATNLVNAINGSTGHNGKLTATAVDDVVTIKQLDIQSTVGTIGNTTVTATAQFNQKVDGSVSSTFSGGTDSDYYLFSKSITKEGLPPKRPLKLSNSSSILYPVPYNISSEPQFPYEIYVFQKEIFFKRSDGEITTFYSASYTPGAQQHITCRVTSSQMEIFINGVGSGVSGSDKTVKQTQNTANVYVGSKGNKSNFLSGSMSQINIFNKALSDVQVLNHYTSNNGSPYIGNIFYNNGFVAITHPGFISALDTTGDGIINTLQFQGSHQIYEHEYQCTIEEHEYNNTTNISARKIKSKDEEEMANFQTSSAFKPYITTVGLYNENNELLVVGKMAQPIRTSNETDTTIVLRWDT